MKAFSTNPDEFSADDQANSYAAATLILVCVAVFVIGFLLGRLV